MNTITNMSIAHLEYIITLNTQSARIANHIWAFCWLHHITQSVSHSSNYDLWKGNKQNYKASNNGSGTLSSNNDRLRSSPVSISAVDTLVPDDEDPNVLESKAMGVPETEPLKYSLKVLTLDVYKWMTWKNLKMSRIQVIMTEIVIFFRKISQLYHNNRMSMLQKRNVFPHWYKRWTLSLWKRSVTVWSSKKR